MFTKMKHSKLTVDLNWKLLIATETVTIKYHFKNKQTNKHIFPMYPLQNFRKQLAT